MIGLLRLPRALKPFAWTLGLAGTTLLLALALSFEWFYLSRDLIVKPSPVTPPSPDSLGASIQLEGHAIPMVSEYNHTVERPLFMENRRPTPPPSLQPPPKREPPAPVTFKLMGVINSPKGPVALIIDNKGKYKRLKPQENTEGWEVNEIRPDRLVVEQSGIKEDLDLIKKHPKNPQAAGDPEHLRQAPPPQGQAPITIPPTLPPPAQPYQAPPPQQAPMQDEGAMEESNGQEDY